MTGLKHKNINDWKPMDDNNNVEKKTEERK